MGAIYDKVMRAVEPYRDISASDYAAAGKLKAEADAAFTDALRDRGIDATMYKIVVHIDELVGPMCFVQGPGGRNWTLAEFERAVAN